MKQLQEIVSWLFTLGMKREAKGESPVKQAELFQQIGKLKSDLVWLKKISAAVMRVNYAGLSNQTTLISATVASPNSCGCLDQPIAIDPLRSGNPSRGFTAKIDPLYLGKLWVTTLPRDHLAPKCSI